MQKSRSDNKYYPNAFSHIKKRFSHQISITAKTGVGSTTCLNGLKRVFEDLPYRYVGVGNIVRNRGTMLKFKSVEEFAEHKKDFPEEGHDQWCDEMTEIFALQNYNITDGRIPHIFMPYACKILLVCSLKTCAKRRCADLVKSKPEITLQTVEQMMRKRDTDDSINFSSLYPHCMWNRTAFDCVISTEHLSKEEVVKAVIEGHKKWLRTLKPSDIIQEMYLPQFSNGTVAA